MYVVTNRKLNPKAQDLSMFGETPNDLGPNELRLVEVTPEGGDYRAKLLSDKLTRAEVKALKDRFKLDIDATKPWYASFRVACEVMVRAQREQRHILLFVHGYNNDMAAVMKTAEALEALYRVVVVPFSWPANGGGLGVAQYLDDKRDARVSMDALNRFVAKVHEYHQILSQPLRTRLRDAADQANPSNPSAANESFAAQLAEECQVTLNLACHSMGNYVLKHALGPSGAASREMVFDNVALIAADANNPGHPEWVEKIQARNRLFVSINEDDYALSWSRRKPGDEQLERLGQYLLNLGARNARYVDVTGAKGVGNAHTYFIGEPVAANEALRTFFAAVFEGGRAEQPLSYTTASNTYRLPA